MVAVCLVGPNLVLDKWLFCCRPQVSGAGNPAHGGLRLVRVGDVDASVLLQPQPGGYAIVLPIGNHRDVRHPHPSDASSDSLQLGASWSYLVR